MRGLLYSGTLLAPSPLPLPLPLKQTASRILLCSRRPDKNKNERGKSHSRDTTPLNNTDKTKRTNKSQTRPAYHRCHYTRQPSH